MASMNFFERATIQRTSGLMTALVCSLLISGGPASAQNAKPELIKKSIEDLMTMEITSVSKKPQKLSETAAAAFVITQDDIRRSGATTLPEVLRMAPGVEVARIDNNKWSIAARGFSGRFANKLLVLLDGRSVYTPLFSGVFWNALEVMLENIDRIEVIRGPGAALWGPNAVNGVINIITKRAEETTGTLVSAAGGIHAPASGAVRQGGSLGGYGFYRGYAKYNDQSSTRTTAGTAAADRSSDTRGGFRTDWNLGSGSDVVVAGELARDNSGEWNNVPQSVIPPFFALSDARTRNSETSLSGQWTRKLSDTSDFAVQSYYDRTTFVGPLAIDRLNTGELDFQHRIQVSSHEVLWGLNYRFNDDKTALTGTSSFAPPVRDTHILSTFIQDDIELKSNRLRLTVGSKFHDDSYSGFGIQPSIRLLWTPASRHSLWLALSRALRTPSRYESDLRQFHSVVPDPTGNPNAPGVALTFSGSPSFRSETLRAHEFGYRVRPSNRLSLDVAGFYNVYDRLRTFESGAPFVSTLGIPHLVSPFTSGNGMRGETYGVEFSADARLRQNWRLTGNYSYLSMQLHLLKGSDDTVSLGDEGSSPKHQTYIRSSFDIAKNIETDVTWRMVGQLPSLQVARYNVADLRLSFRTNSFTEFSVAAQNLGTGRGHSEFAPTYTDAMPLAVLIRPSVLMKATFKF
jgi:iron complex outermembrane receptor protein